MLYSQLGRHDIITLKIIPDSTSLFIQQKKKSILQLTLKAQTSGKPFFLCSPQATPTHTHTHSQETHYPLLVYGIVLTSSY